MPAPYTSPIAEAVAVDLLDRFTRYVQFDTQSAIERTQSPSTPGQLELSRALLAELLDLGLADAELDEHGYVYATLAANVDGAPVIGLIAHVDTSPEASGAGVHPLLHRDYDGGVIELPSDGVRLDPERMPELREKVGHDLVTSSGDTLLGADDKAGVAAIMAALRYLIDHPEARRSTLRVCFTPDEEIGHGATLFDIPKFGARCAYTIDGSSLGELQDESFTAIGVRIAITGVNVHPGQANGKMASALRLATDLVAALPKDSLTPAVTDGRDGFIHPMAIDAAPDRAEIRLIVRDFDEDLLDSHLQLLRRTADEVLASEPRASMEFEVTRQYRNMHEYIAEDPTVVAAAVEAMRAEGIEPVRTPIRGGTDGSRLSEMGLPTPNIFDGGHEYHSVREWASLQEMSASAATIVRLAGVWADRGGGS
jgi:tripeptide aminopeptidase